MIRNAVLFGVAVAGASWMFYLVVSGLRVGRIEHGNSTYSMKKQPVRFALIALLSSAFGGMFVYMAVQKGMEIFRGF